MLYESEKLNIDDLFVSELKYILEQFNATMGEIL